jgi:archaellum component FlaF (FlaF/FlaG flagellin family)
MVVAALICFAILLVAWLLAPEETTAAQQPMADATVEPELAALPEAA